MNKPWPFIWIIGAVCLAVFLMFWVFTQSASNTDNAANRPGGEAIPPASSGPAEQRGTVGAGGATSDSTRATPGPSPSTDRTRQ